VQVLHHTKDKIPIIRRSLNKSGLLFEDENLDITQEDEGESAHVVDLNFT
jgi:hypothetical protein